MTLEAVVEVVGGLTVVAAVVGIGLMLLPPKRITLSLPFKKKSAAAKKAA